MSSETSSTSIDGTSYYYQTSGAADAIVHEPGNALRFTVHPGDVWSPDPDTINRSEIASGTQIADKTPVHVAYQMTIQSGAVDPNPSSWAVLGQFHQNDGANVPRNSPPFSVQIVAGKMQIAIGYTDAVSNDTSRVIWTDKTNIVQGATYAMDIKATFDPNGNGHLSVSRNGVTLVNYTGPLGYHSQSSVYWKEGIYRGASASTMVATYANLTVATGSTSTPTALASAGSPVGFRVSSTTSDYDASTGKVTGGVIRYVSADARQTLEKRFNASGTLIYQQQMGLDGSRTTTTYGVNGALQQSMAVHADGSSDNAQYGLTGRTYVSLLTHQDSQGVITWQQESFADGSKVSAERGSAGQTYKTMMTFFNAAGAKTRASYLYPDGSSGTYSYAGNGAVTQAMLTAKDGTQTTTTYAGSGVMQKSKIVRTDGSKDYTNYNASGIKTDTFFAQANGSSETDVFAGNGKTTLKIVKADDGTQTTTDDTSNGVIQQSKVIHTDGSRDYTNYNAAGVKTNTFFAHADGSSETDVFASNGKTTLKIVKARDGTQTTTNYTSNGVIHQTKVIHTDGSRDYTSYNTAGVKTNTFFIHVDGSSETDIFAINGALTQKIIKAKDGTQTIDSYGLNGALDDMKMIYKDGSRLYMDYNVGTHLSVMTKVNAAGATTAVQQIEADGSATGQAFAAGVTLVSQGGNDSFTSDHNDTFVFHPGFGHDTISGFHGAGSLHDVLQIDKSLVADVSHLNMTQSGANTLITVSPHDSITLKGVNMSALSTSNFSFV